MVEREDALVPLLGALRDLVAWLRGTQVQGLVIGGVAASLLGRPRLTRDIDVVILLDETKWQAFLLRRIRRWVREFSSALATREILDDLERILKRRSKRKS